MKVTIIGTGTWGSALAQVLVDNGHDVLMYGRDNSQVNDINDNHQNSFYFGKDIYLSNRIKATNNLNVALLNYDYILLSVPTVAMREVLNSIKPLLRKKTIFINTAKGFDPSSNKTMSSLIREIIPEEYCSPVVSLIGPSHAEEVILRHLTLLCSVSLSLRNANKVQALFSNDYLRVYTLKDEVGAEYGVASKNAVAIASGILEGLGLGDNARAALCTRAINEMVRIGVYFGAKAKTYLGLTGIGDLVVTCYSKHSRNFMAGYQIGLADNAEQFLKENTKTVEGIRTTKVLHELSLKYNLNTPIINSIYEILYDGKRPSEIIKSLMLRSLKKEY